MQLAMKERPCKAVCQKDPSEFYREGAFPMPWSKFHEGGTVTQKIEQSQNILIV